MSRYGRALAHVSSRTLFLSLALIMAAGLFVPAERAHAQSENRFAGAGVSEGVEEMPWLIPGNITADDGSEAAISSYDSDECEQTLRSHTYGFTIPGGATIDGIELIVGRRNSSGGGSVSDNVIQLAKAGVAVGSNKSTGVTWPTSEASITYGSPTDLWGTTWTPAEINAGGFGATLNPLNTGNAEDAEVDYHRIIVYYNTGSDTTPPDDVTDLATGTVTSSSIDLSWTAPGDDGATGTATTYDVRYSTSTITAGNWASATQATGEPAPSVAGSAETFTVTGLSESTTYFFAIKTSDEVPNESVISNVPSATTADGTAPDAVADLATGTVTASSIDLSWTAPGDDGATGTATSYDVRYSTSTITEGNWATATQATGEPAPQAAGSGETFTVTGLSASTTYFFAIKTSDEVPNESAISNVPSAATSAPDVTAPDAVTDLATGTITASTVQLSWTAPGDDGATGTATSYDVRYSTSTITEGNWAAATQATGEPAPQSAGSAETFTVTGLSFGTIYYFAIKSSDEVPNEAAISNVPSAATSSTGIHWGRDVQNPSHTTVNHSRAMGGDSPNVDNMVIDTIAMYLSGTGSIRLAVYTGGALNAPSTATLLYDFGSISVAGAGWYKIGHPSGGVAWPKFTPTWLAWKSNTGVTVYY